ncbi:ATPase [Arsukibacterium sp. MJ3]|nr:ATPase [Arsukibacterium sp. MJ3]
MDVQEEQTTTKKPVAKQNAMQQRITKLLKQLGEGMHEREQVLAIALLGAIAGHNTFLYGPPGTAKSLISRRLAAAFDQPKYFEYLMNRFSTPEEVFGPVSIKELKQDRYTRQIDGYLPTADFAFLDEIWKSSPAILNSLLTIINEHIFKNGAERVQVPLKSLIAASNEVPAENQGLEALFDRFIIRLVVPPITAEENFARLLNSKPSSDKPAVARELLISYNELEQWREQLHNVQLSADTMLVIKYIRQQLAERFDELKVYVSDRRWQRAAMLLKASAFCNGRKETNHSDTLLLKHCLWTAPDNQPKVVSLVDDAVKRCGFDTEIDLAKLDKEKEALDKEINHELFHSEDIYKTETLKDGQVYFKVVATFKYSRRGYGYNTQSDEKKTLYVPLVRFKTQGEFHPVDFSGNENSGVKCEFDGQGSCKLTLNNSYYEDYTFDPKILFHRGDKKQDINERLVKSLATSVKDIRNQLALVLNQVHKKHKKLKTELFSPFATDEETDIAVDGITTQTEQIKLRIADCERLESLCQQ